MTNLANRHARRVTLSSVLVGTLLLVGLSSPAVAATRSHAETTAAAPSPAETTAGSPSPGPDERHSDSADEATDHALTITEPTATETPDVEGGGARAANAQITGTVKGSDGEALPGVVVSVWSSEWDGVTAWDYPLTFAESVVTDGAGVFRFTVAEGHYSLFYNPVDDPDSAWSWVGGQAVPAKYPTLVGAGGWRANATLGVPHSISGALTGGPNYTPLSAPMTLWACNERESTLWCSPNWDSSSGPAGYGFWQLPAGYYLVEVSAPNARYKGEWWNDKPDFAASDFIHVAQGVDTFSNINLEQYVQILPALTVTGKAAVGGVMSLTVPAKVSGATYRYFWYADNDVIAGSSNKTSITLTSAQAGKQISARVNVTKTGYRSANRFSEKTTRVIANSAPTITGTLAVGRTLTAHPNAWTSGTTFTYQWYANRTAIAGATESTYKLTLADRDKQIQIGIKGSKTGYTTLFRGSLATAMVAQIARPTISGTPKVGQRLTAQTPGWTPGTTFQYRWFADGTAISGALTSSLAIAPAYVGKTITVRVAGAKPGYISFSQTSRPTAPVVR